MTTALKNLKTKLKSQSTKQIVKRMALTVSACMSASVLLGCNHHYRYSDDTTGGITGLAITSGNSISVYPATAAQCATGGNVYAVYFDANNNGVLDGKDTVVSTQAICNGSSGANGLTTVVGLNRVSVSAEICASGSGLQVSSGPDANSNSVLDASEITQSQVVCDGAIGSTGATGSTGAAGNSGTPGSNGHGIVMKFLTASSTSCPAGGTTILMAVDSDDSGALSEADTQLQSTNICNGANGTNGTNGINAQTPAYSAVDAIMPCGNTVSNKEVLLRLANGEILASVSDSVSGNNTRFSFMVDGNYMDTDGSSCNFTVATSADGLTRSIAWFGQVQSSWAAPHSSTN